jgi:acyl carrier protein
MDAHAISRRIKTFIEKQFPLARTRQIGMDYALLENGIVDSLGVLDLVNYLETEFHLSIADDDLVPDNFQTINKLTQFVQTRIASAPVSSS